MSCSIILLKQLYAHKWIDLVERGFANASEFGMRGGYQSLRKNLIRISKSYTVC